MTIIRRSVGVGTLLLSFLGIVLSVAGSAGVWIGKTRLDPVITTLFGTADDAFIFIETKLDLVNQTLDESRKRLSGLSELAERAKSSSADLNPDFEPLLRTLDEVREKLKAAEHWLESSRAIAEGVNKMSNAIALSEAAKSDDESAGANAKKVAEFAAEVAQALARVEVMREEMLALREKKELARAFVGGMIVRVSELDERIANVSEKIDAFNARVSTARASSVELARRVHWWITFATMMLMLLFIWFAVSQACMMKHGWRLARVVSEQVGGEKVRK